MLTFLRKIRRTLIGSGLSRKYILYAIGEIALVVIGILIALQVNNWNQYRKERIEERNYLIRLYEDLQRDSTRLQTGIKLTTFKANGALYNLEEINKIGSVDFDTSEFIKQAFLIGVTILISPESSPYEELISSGKFDIITNEDLKSNLNRYMSGSRRDSRTFSDANDSRKAYNEHLRQFFSALIWNEMTKSVRDQGTWEFPLNPDQLKTDLRGYQEDTKSVYHISNIASIHQSFQRTYEIILNERLIPMMQLIRKDLKMN